LGNVLFIIRFIIFFPIKILIIILFFLFFFYKCKIRLKKIHEKSYIHRDLHSGNIFSYDNYNSKIGDLGLCQQIVNKDDPNKIYGVIPYLAPEVLAKKLYTKESDIYSFGMIMWEHTTGKKPFHDRPHNSSLILDISKGERPQITNDTPEFYAKLMKGCWDHDPKNRPSAIEIFNCIKEYYYIPHGKEEIIRLAEIKRQKFIKSEEYLSDMKNYKHHPESFYTSRLLNESIEQAYSLTITSTN
jgi:serine/threonine protein kinase